MLFEVTSLPIHGILAASGFEPRVRARDSGALLLTVRGARILGVYLGGFEQNLLWTNDAVLSSEAAARQFLRDGGWNLGGDRCWLSPEIELHFLDAENPSYDLYGVAPGIDPGDYGIERETPTGLALHSAGRAGNSLTHGSFTFIIRRDIRLCDPPVDTASLSYVGFEISSYLEILSTDHSNSRYGLWLLMQLPAGGVVYVPCLREPQQLDYFGTGVGNHASYRRGAIEFPITGTAQHKLGLRAHDVRGRMGYLRPTGDGRSTLIVRQAGIFPGATYMDYPAHDRRRRDIALQFYNDGGSFGGFGEMEYHVPAAGPAGLNSSRDVSRTWCFGGDERRIREVARELLGVGGEAA